MLQRITGSVTSVAAALTALAVFACCVPIGLAGAAGVLMVGSLFDVVQPWLLGVSGILLASSIVWSYRGQKTCQRRRSRVSLAVLGLSSAIVLLVLLFPQAVAGWIADYVL